jgi:hypothetical protein
MPEFTSVVRLHRVPAVASRAAPLRRSRHRVRDSKTRSSQPRANSPRRAPHAPSPRRPVAARGQVIRRRAPAFTRATEWRGCRVGTARQPSRHRGAQPRRLAHDPVTVGGREAAPSRLLVSPYRQSRGPSTTVRRRPTRPTRSDWSRTTRQSPRTSRRSCSPRRAANRSSPVECHPPRLRHAGSALVLTGEGGVPRGSRTALATDEKS